MSDVKEFEVTAKDLPLHCPTAEVALWRRIRACFWMSLPRGMSPAPIAAPNTSLKQAKWLGIINMEEYDFKTFLESVPPNKDEIGRAHV